MVGWTTRVRGRSTGRVLCRGALMKSGTAPRNYGVVTTGSTEVGIEGGVVDMEP